MIAVFDHFDMFLFNYVSILRYAIQDQKPKHYIFLETNGPHTDDAILVTSKESLTISRPGERDSLGRVGLLANVGELGLELINNRLGLQIPDLDAR